MQYKEGMLCQNEGIRTKSISMNHANLDPWGRTTHVPKRKTEDLELTIIYEIGRSTAFAATRPTHMPTLLYISSLICVSRQDSVQPSIHTHGCRAMRTIGVRGKLRTNLGQKPRMKNECGLVRAVTSKTFPRGASW